MGGKTTYGTERIPVIFPSWGLNLSMCETKGELDRMQGWVLSLFVSATNHFGKLSPSWTYLFFF